MVNDFSNLAGCFTFTFTNMMLSEKELAVKIANFNIVIISDCNFSTLATEAHQAKHFDELASQGSSSNHKAAAFGSSMHKIVTEEQMIVMVAIVSWCARSWPFGEDLKELMMQPLA
jgi:hypothetical protein